MTTEAQTLVLDVPGGRRVATVLEWEHVQGGRAHCLARLLLHPAPTPPVAVLSELADNPDRFGLTGDMGGAATAFLAQMRPYATLDPRSPVWIAHHGPFSSFDDDGGGETFTRVGIAHHRGALHDDLSGHHLLTAAQVLAEIAPLHLHPVPEVLTELRCVRI
ncbi:hypothetical protein ACGFR8_13600 [Streptomyces brevispora]|uniref:hypothetical protein n=1 Tax=Streptomyces brevispora TaxID=887462 RepID=UPI00371DE9BE